MAIIIHDYEPSGDVEEVQFPGSKTRYEIPKSDVLTVADIEKLGAGDFTPLIELFPEEGRVEFRKLRGPQVEDFVQAWMGSAKN